VSAWIEIRSASGLNQIGVVALLVSAWIEIRHLHMPCNSNHVALLVSAWIEMMAITKLEEALLCRTPCECVD